MKRLLSYLFITCLASILSMSDTFSQHSLVARPKRTSYFTYGDILANPLKDGSLVESRVSLRALSAFKNFFQSGVDPKWFRIGKDYLVCFRKNGNRAKALYNVKGHLISSFYYGHEKDLPIDVKRILSREYPDYNIILAREIFEQDRNFWAINLDDDNNLVCVNVENGWIQKTSSCKKAK